ncbi:iron ABC transporter permease [Carboxylicivirga sp. A043]|uniref:FecCD family ABC transporter permease n=1 Tax=Carboxylicivirga litoralis TaxID=2816963 RepID=UPI0021CB9421|nr:iron ABC transporter permease [Carboxylicivirga sp. A043]MCU4155113.1 iron ABC transporter permease [Carboxylicivirga sp. A043]
MMHIVNNKTKYATLILLVLALLLLNMILGSVHIPIKAVFQIISGQETSNIIWENIITRSRLPQAIVALGAGMGLGIAGLLMQTLFRNPLAGPSVLGISSGASLGVGFVILVAGQFFGFSFSSLGLFGDLSLLVAALAGSLCILLVILFVSRRIGGTLAVLIIGVMIGYLSNSVVGIMKFYSLEEDVHTYVIWGLGSFSRLSLARAQLFLVLITIPAVACLFISKWLNLLSLGENYAQNLGLKIHRARMVVILMSGVLTALVTAFCGPIVFIGMAVPHMAKLVARTSNHFTLILHAGLLGAATALLCNVIARMPGLDSALPINSVTAFIGAPVVISVIWKRRKEQFAE